MAKRKRRIRRKGLPCRAVLDAHVSLARLNDRRRKQVKIRERIEQQRVVWLKRYDEVYGYEGLRKVFYRLSLGRQRSGKDEAIDWHLTRYRRVLLRLRAAIPAALRFEEDSFGEIQGLVAEADRLLRCISSCQAGLMKK